MALPSQVERSVEMSRPVMRRPHRRRSNTGAKAIVYGALLLGACGSPWNNPYPASEGGTNRVLGDSGMPIPRAGPALRERDPVEDRPEGQPQAPRPLRRHHPEL
ncbi:MAG: hypothetical protein HUU18_07385, partial [Phycisphaerales bacterium]|nr:hypothetical protein [Phycisphaerales bacterium]